MKALRILILLIFATFMLQNCASTYNVDAKNKKAEEIIDNFGEYLLGGPLELEYFLSEGVESDLGDRLDKIRVRGKPLSRGMKIFLLETLNKENKTVEDFKKLSITILVITSSPKDATTASYEKIKDHVEKYAGSLSVLN